ncbi:four-carbon acid sugar kinase family protein [Anaeromicropila herbilytica]|uniref:Membrane protein n=1 Tax=Anaeromicropila herbilytica TaxID=2785025 RepID=A0A7R7IBM6_9FIRM|nr:four-carbon acid sugar kinase family protein [Anaeromicropila herbilytica]BCN29767.1 membrane protein [Anaeromicropila herbilytica]
MITLLIIADDFTGALDTGVQFAASGANTRVVTSANYDLNQVDSEVQVLVMDAETRHLSPREAYDIVYDITKRAIEQKIPYLYKKTDSALRGNIGSELTAMLSATGERTLSFLPAFPKMKRWTKEGIHYIDDVPVSESVFGKDPFEPVTCSYIPQIIGIQSEVKVSIRTDSNRHLSEKKYSKETQTEPELLVWDAKTDEELETLGQYLYDTDQMHLTAGCAGFATVLPKLLGLERVSRQNINLIPNLLVICGSVNPITAAQLDYAEKNGFLRIRLKPEERLDQEFWTSSHGQEKLSQWKDLLTTHSCVILDSNDLPGREDTKDYAKAHGLSLDEIRMRIAVSYGYILKYLLESGLQSTLMITGGDTLLGCMENLGVREMEPICELAPGTVLSNFSLGEKRNQVISKSGGFGQETLLVDLACKISSTTI